jgi:hypothetical protein
VIGIQAQAIGALKWRDRSWITRARAAVRAFLWRTFPSAMLVATYTRRVGRLPRLRHPQTFTEKVLHKMVFDRDPRLTLFADKFAVREYVKATLGGDEHLTQLHAVIDTPSHIRELQLPDRFVMKPNHMSDAVKIVRDATAVRRAELEALATSWLKRNYGIEMGEWAYRAIRPRVLFEELLEFGGELAIDYDIYCFDGEPRFVRVLEGKFGLEPRATVYDTEFRLHAARLAKAPFLPVTEERAPPPNFERMLEIARQLSRGTDFIRVDLYNLGGRIVFGELTNYPHAGRRPFDPADWELRFGGYWPPCA